MEASITFVKDNYEFILGNEIIFKSIKYPLNY